MVMPHDHRQIFTYMYVNIMCEVGENELVTILLSLSFAISRQALSKCKFEYHVTGYNLTHVPIEAICTDRGPTWTMSQLLNMLKINMFHVKVLIRNNCYT